MGFGRSILFAALAAAGLPLFVGLLGPLLGHATALHFYLAGTAVAYLAAIAPTLRGAIAAGALAAVLGAVLLALPLRLPALAVGLAVVIAACRSGWLYRSRPMRAIALEGVLLGVGVSLAGFLAGSDLISLALATWGYYLTQSLYRVVGGALPRPADPARDPFERARSDLLALLS